MQNEDKSVRLIGSTQPCRLYKDVYRRTEKYTLFGLRNHLAKAFAEYDDNELSVKLESNNFRSVITITEIVKTTTHSFDEDFKITDHPHHSTTRMAFIRLNGDMFEVWSITSTEERNIEHLCAALTMYTNQYVVGDENVFQED